MFAGFLLITLVPGLALAGDAPSREDAVARALDMARKEMSGEAADSSPAVYEVQPILVTPRGASVKPAPAAVPVQEPRGAAAGIKTADSPPAGVPSENLLDPRQFADIDAYYGESIRARNFFDLKNPLLTIDFGAEGYAYTYREPGVMKDKGFLYGVFGTYTYRTAENQPIRSIRDVFTSTSKINMYRIDARFAYGKVDYENSGTLDNIDYYVTEVRGLAGYDFPLNEDSRITPFLGVGFRYLYDDGGGTTTSTGYWTYDRESRYFYLPVGLEFSGRLKSGWTLGLTAEYDVFLDGKQTSHLEDGGAWIYDKDANAHTPDALHKKQRSGYGLRGALRLGYSGEKVDFFFEPFVRYWNIGESDLGQLSSGGHEYVWYLDEELTMPYYFYEPENNTTEYGMKTGLRF